MTYHVLGIDPGKEAGGAVLLDAAGQVVAGFTWREKDGAWMLESNLDRTTASQDSAQPLETLHQVGRTLRATLNYLLNAGPFVLVVEGLFVGKGARTSLTLAESAALVYGPLLDDCANRDDFEAWRPPSNSWGKAIGWRDLLLGLDW
jgi:hypothetical protein